MRVVLTRSPEDIQKDREVFEREGFEVIALPLIQEVPLHFEVPRVEFDFVVFQSPRAVRLFLSKYRLDGEKVVVVGEKTKREVERFGYEVWAMPEDYYGKELLKIFRGLSGKVLLPRSGVGRDEVVEGLRELGLEVYPLEVYTLKEKIYERGELVEKLSGADAVLFASPSALKGLLANLQKEDIKRLLAGKVLVCLGKTTEDFLKETLCLYCHTPEKPTLEKVVELLKTMALKLHNINGE
ncbi:MAG: uroporphyrinogen-III synthase [Aquificaceae bacterium]|nr:uroporphyrinogen-III synthase [Aquificaceae bacterium]